MDQLAALTTGLTQAATTAVPYIGAGIAGGAVLLGARHGIRVGVEALKRIGRG